MMILLREEDESQQELSRKSFDETFIGSAVALRAREEDENGQGVHEHNKSEEEDGNALE